MHACIVPGCDPPSYMHISIRACMHGVCYAFTDMLHCCRQNTCHHAVPQAIMRMRPCPCVAMVMVTLAVVTQRPSRSGRTG